MVVNPVQPEKQLSPNDVTFEGMEIVVNPMQLRKHSSPNDVTFKGMEMDVKLLQPSYLLLVDYQYFTP